MTACTATASAPHGSGANSRPASSSAKRSGWGSTWRATSTQPYRSVTVTDSLQVSSKSSRGRLQVLHSALSSFTSRGSRTVDKPDGFRRHHLSEWALDAWFQLAHEAWGRYDRWADRQETPGSGLPPKFRVEGAPPGVKSFQGLMYYVADDSFWEAKRRGYPVAPEQWRQEVHRAGRDR